MRRHSHHTLGRGLGELFRHGIIYAIEQQTGAIKPLSTKEYAECERVGLLDGYLVRLGRAQAEACAAEIRAKCFSTN